MLDIQSNITTIIERHATVDLKDIEHILSPIDFSGIAEKVKSNLQVIHADSAKEQLADIGINDAGIFDLVDSDALAWAKDRAAELVGRKYHGNILVENPNAAWSIEETTREGIRDLVQAAYTEGLTPRSLAQKIADAFEFSASRARTIARTETARASVQGAVNGWRRSGLVDKKESILSDDHNKDDECNEAADDGAIGIDEEFSNGEDGPPYHPNCDCVLVASFESEESGSANEETM